MHSDDRTGTTRAVRLTIITLSSRGQSSGRFRATAPGGTLDIAT